MEIEKRTGHNIYFDGCDTREANKKSNYSDYTTKERIKNDKKVWVSLDSFFEWINKNSSKIEDATMYHHSSKKVYTNQTFHIISRKELIKALDK